MDRVLTIVGASARAAACSAVRAGLTVHAADLFADADLRSCCHAVQIADYPHGLAKIVRGPQPGGWIYTGALENYPALVQKLSQIRPLLGNGADVLRRVRHPQKVANALRAAGLIYPAIAWDGDSLERDGSWLRKSVRSAGGSQVAVWDRHAGPEPLRDDFYFQRRIDGPACSAVYVAAGGDAVLLGVTRQLIGAAWTGATGFQYCGSIGPLALAADVATSFARIGEVLARAFDLVGLFGVDAIVNEQGVWPVEVNPRYTASTELIEWTGGLNAVDLHLAACTSGRLPSVVIRPPRQCFGKAILFAPQPLVVTAELNAFLFEPHRQEPPAFADIPVAGTAIEAGWPIVTVLAAAADERAVLEKLQQRVAQVQSLIPR
ncbi:MAG TPA: ATP-grasp domain-containing protein [Pirellulales bacterium]|nr:ATP-grasp domain-containing protein [Pirellulales bacterium]